MEVMEKETHAIGKNISTKAVGSRGRNDITHLYKHEEGKASFVFHVFVRATLSRAAAIESHLQRSGKGCAGCHLFRRGVKKRGVQKPLEPSLVKARIICTKETIGGIRQ